MNRRTFTNKAIASLLLSSAACSNYKIDKQNFVHNCGQAADDQMLRIDMHCHLMNFLDINTGEFLKRRQFNQSNTSDNVRETVGYVNSRIRAFFDRDVVTARTEANNLLYMYRQNRDKFEAEDFCEENFPKKTELFRSNDGTQLGMDRRLGDGRLTGFFSGRSRNAAIMMAQFTKVDLFMPSIVDLYDGNPERFTDPTRQVQFHTALNIATKGRFLPLVSFHPERYYHEVKDLHAFTNIDLVKQCITRLGFVGVKVHPTSGFDPLSTERYGVPNVQKLIKERNCGVSLDDGKYTGGRGTLREKFQIMDDGMKRLYDLCDQLDVPILSHGANSLGVDPFCMNDHPDPNEWTNSSRHWIKAISKHASKNSGRTRVCLGHFASGFGEMKPAKDDPLGESQFRYTDASKRELQPTQWLQEVVSYYRNTRNPRVVLDLSIMTELALSKSVAENGGGEDGPWKYRRNFNPDFKSTLRDARKDGGNFANRFTEFLAKNPNLTRHLMYGTDAHMPGVSAISGGDAYQSLIERCLPNSPGLKARVMGLNAADFFGLRRGRKTRARIEAFHKDFEIDTRATRWARKLDS